MRPGQIAAQRIMAVIRDHVGFLKIEVPPEWIQSCGNNAATVCLDLLEDISEESTMTNDDKPTTSPELRDLLASVAGARTSQAAKDDISKAVRALEAELADALGGDKLRGLPNLGTQALPLYGLNLNGLNGDTRIPFPKDGDVCGESQVILNDQGKVVRVTATRRDPGPVARISLNVRPWFEFESTPTTPTPYEISKLTSWLPRALRNHVDAVRAENQAAEDAVATTRRLTDTLKKGQ